MLLAIIRSSLANNNVITEHYTMNSGLANDIVNCSVKDNDGFLWFGTWYGLCRFDGTEFRTFNRAEVEGSSQPPRKVETIVEDENGDLWLKTLDWKLSFFDKHKEKFYSIYDEIKPYSRNIQIIKIQRAPFGGILILTKDKTLLWAKVERKLEKSGWFGKDKVNQKLVVKLLADNHRDINSFSSALLRNAVRETPGFISYVGKDFSLVAARKLTRKMLVPRGVAFSSAAHEGNYFYLGCNDGHLIIIDVYSGKVKMMKMDSAPVRILPVKNVHGKKLFVATKKYYSCIDFSAGKQSRLALENDGSENVRLFTDKHNNLWTYQIDGSLRSYNLATKSTRRYSPSIFGHLMEPKLVDTGSHGIYFLTSAGEVMHIGNDGSPQPALVSDNPLEQYQRFFDIDIDKDGLLWLSSTGNGVYRFAFPSSQFRLLRLPFSDANGQCVRSIFQMDNGDVWVGTRSKDLLLLNADGGVKKIYSYADYHIGSVYYIMKDNRGRIWFATKGDGLFMVTPKPDGDYSFTKFAHNPSDKHSLSGNSVYTIFQDSKGRIWVGTLDGGLNLLQEHNGRISFLNKQNGLGIYPRYGLYMEVRNISEDRWGRVWVGTIDGLMSFPVDFTDPHKIKMEIYRRRGLSTIANSDVYALYTDSQRDVWMSAFVGGLNKITGYDADKHAPIFNTVSTLNGLRSDVILSIVDDNRGTLWLATDKGLSCYNKLKGTVTNYDNYDGFPDVQMEETASMRSRNGDIWLGTRQGLLIFNPRRLKINDTDWNTYIIRCAVNNKTLYDKALPYADKIVLKHNEDMFTLEYAALNFTSQDRISYRYILEGYDKAWHNNGTNRIASYTNVPPGTYTFRVQTLRGNDSRPSERTLEIEILPPWWASTFAYIIYIALLILAAYGALRLILYIIRMRNAVYINNRLAELKVKFFTNVSHELRTPLTLIQGAIHELRGKEQLSDAGNEYLAMMESNSKRMITLVNQILDLRKIQSGRLKLHVSHADVCAVVGAFRSEFGVLAKERKVSFRFILPDDIKVWMDTERIGIVVRNILSNAFKFTPVGGEIDVMVEAVGNDECVISVENSGSRVPEDKLEEIFTRFSQADAPVDTNAKGTGIGLELTREIVRLHGGNISVENTDNGVRFIVSLPMSREHFSSLDVEFEEEPTEVAVAPSPMTDALNADKPLVLFVDDNNDLCRMLTLQLSDNYRVLTANNGEQALADMQMQEPDIVVTDQMMPIMDGMQLLSEIRKNFSTSHIPVIMLTAKDDDESKTEAMKRGANNYVTKPFSIEYLKACVEQLLSQRELFRQRIVVEEENSSDEYARQLDKRDRGFISSIHDIIDLHISEKEFNMDSIAQQLGVSRSSFFKKVKSLTGYSPMDLLKEYRMNKAEKLLRTTEHTISSIAFQSGFSDISYFGKCFRKKYGVSPKEYREKMRS